MSCDIYPLGTCANWISYPIGVSLKMVCIRYTPRFVATLRCGEKDDKPMACSTFFGYQINKPHDSCLVVTSEVSLKINQYKCLEHVMYPTKWSHISVFGLDCHMLSSEILKISYRSVKSKPFRNCFRAVFV